MIDYWMKTSNDNNFLGTMKNSFVGGHVRYCVLGTGTSAPTRNQTALDSQIGSDKSFQTHSASPDFGVYGVYTETTYEFQEDECNGDLTEWGIKPSLTAIGSLLCRELFRDENGDPVVLTKTSSQVLRMTYRLYAQRVSDCSESTVTCGDTTYTCKGYMVNRHLVSLLGMKQSSPYVFSYSAYSFLYNITTTETTAIYLGTSNSPSNFGDSANEIKAGKTTVYPSLLPVLSEYVDGSYEREIIWSFAGSEANMNIGEMIINSSYSGDCNIARITFDPPIAKDSSKKLKIGAKIAITL